MHGAQNEMYRLSIPPPCLKSGVFYTFALLHINGSRYN